MGGQTENRAEKWLVSKDPFDYSPINPIYGGVDAMLVKFNSFIQWMFYILAVETPKKALIMLELQMCKKIIYKVQECKKNVVAH